MSTHRSAMLQFRKAAKDMADVLSVDDQQWHLCRQTGKSYRDLWDLATETCNWEQFLTECGYSPSANKTRLWKEWDGGWWATVIQWCKQYVKQWEAGVHNYVSEENQNKLAVLDPDAQDKVLAAASKALNIAPEVLTHFVQHREEIELFLEAARSTLGTLAESKLWELVMAGDAATIRWLLPRIKNDVFGDRLMKVEDAVEKGKVTSIKIIDVE